MAGIGKYTEGKKFTLKSGNTPDKSSFFKDTTTTEISAPPSDEITKKTNDEELETTTSSGDPRLAKGGFKDLGHGAYIHPSGVMAFEHGGGGEGGAA